MVNKKPRMQAPLHNAIRNGEKDFIEKLFQYDYVNDIETTDELGLTPLHTAILCKNDAIAKLLIDNGANVNANSNEGEVLPEIKKAIEKAKVKSMFYGTSDLLKCCTKLSPLHIATINGSLKIVSLLIENGAIVNIENGNSLRPIHAAIHSGFVDIVSLLFKNNALIGNLQAPEFLSHEGLLAHAADDGNAKIMELLFQNGIQAKCKRAFQHALDLGHLDVVEVLVKNGAVIDDYDKYESYPPLYLAALFHEDHEFKMVRFLVEHGADVDILGGEDFDETVLHVASRTGNFELAKYMIQNDADIDCQTIETNYYNGDPPLGSTPLHLAIYNGYTDIAEMLINFGASLDILNSCWHRKTPLHCAIEEENEKIIQALISNGANIEAWSRCYACWEDKLTCVHYQKPLEVALAEKMFKGMKSFLLINHGKS